VGINNKNALDLRCGFTLRFTGSDFSLVKGFPCLSESAKEPLGNMRNEACSKPPPKYAAGASGRRDEQFEIDITFDISGFRRGAG
jgi:hypothetical protein